MRSLAIGIKLKESIQCPKYQLITDSREQENLIFTKLNIFDYVTDKLDVGDYALRLSNGLLFNKIIERKGLQDLVGTLSAGYKRFKEEINRAKESGINLIIAIEGTRDDVLRGTIYSNREGSEVVKQLNTLYVRYGVEFWYCASREDMAMRISDLFHAVYRDLES